MALITRARTSALKDRVALRLAASAGSVAALVAIVEAGRKWS